MHDRTRTGNRAGLAVVGVILLAGGVVLLAAHYGKVLTSAPGQRLYPDTARRFVADHDSWLWPVAVAVAVVIGLVFLRWLLVQGRVDRVRSVVIDTDAESGDDGAGRTRLTASALTHAIEDDLESVRGVRRARVDMSGRTDDPQLWLHVTTDADADIANLRNHVDTVVLPDARTALDLAQIETHVRFDVSRHTGSASAPR